MLNPHRPINRSDSGQVMAESAIGLALLAFVWILVIFSLFMANNRIRTAMAARHAAWYEGNGGAGGAELTVKIDNEFFYQNGYITVEDITPENSADSSSGLKGNSAIRGMLNFFSGNPHQVRVKFG